MFHCHKWKPSAILVCLTILIGHPALSSEEAAPQRKKGVVDQLSGQGYGMAGCGLGSILFGERPGMVQIFASTTNGIYSNNTFAVSSGTSNCDMGADNTASTRVFVDANRLAMQNDIARGSGETLAAFFNIAGCKESDAVGVALQKNYRHIFTDGADSQRVFESIRETIRKNPSTTTSCSNLG